MGISFRVYKLQSAQKLTEKMWTFCMKRVTSCAKPFLLVTFIVPLMCMNIEFVKQNVNKYTFEIHVLLLLKMVHTTQNGIRPEIKLFSLKTLILIFRKLHPSLKQN